MGKAINCSYVAKLTGHVWDIYSVYKKVTDIDIKCIQYLSLYLSFYVYLSRYIVSPFPVLLNNFS